MVNSMETFGVPAGLLSKTEFLDYKTPITKVLPLLDGRYPAVVITKNGEYFGVVDSRAVYRSSHVLRLDKDMYAGDFALRAPVLTPASSFEDAVNGFYSARTRALPYVNGKRIIGVLDRKSLLSAALSLKALDGTRVGEVMSTPVLAIDAATTLASANALMRENKVNRLIVLQGGSFAGLLTKYDILHRYTIPKERLPEMKAAVHSPAQVPVSSVMERSAKTIDEGESLAEATKLMVRSGISSLVAMSGKRPVGVLTVTDIIESLVVKGRREMANVFVSGLDNETMEYGGEMMQRAKEFVKKVGRLSGAEIGYMAITVKRIKTRSYELHARVGFASKGMITEHASGYLLDQTFEELLGLVRKAILKRKERFVSVRKLTPTGIDE